MSASNRLTLLLVDISIYSDLPDQGEAGQTRTDRSNGDGGGDASMLAVPLHSSPRVRDIRE